MGEGENTRDQHFLLFSQCTQSFTLSESFKLSMFDIGLTHYHMTNFGLVQIESLQTTILNSMKIPESSLNG